MEAFGDWHDFFVAQVGASAALAGLLFVAISINIERILKAPWLPARAAMTVVLLLGALVEASIGLWPHQTPFVFGVEWLVVGIAILGIVMRQTFGGIRPPAEFARGTRMTNALVNASALLPIAGALMIVAFDLPLGMYVAGAGMIMALAVGFLNSWVLLVEILR